MNDNPNPILADCPVSMVEEHALFTDSDNRIVSLVRDASTTKKQSSVRLSELAKLSSSSYTLAVLGERWPGAPKGFGLRLISRSVAYIPKTPWWAVNHSSYEQSEPMSPKGKLLAYLNHPTFVNAFTKLVSAWSDPIDPGLHGCYRIDELTPDSFQPVTEERARVLFEEALAEYSISEAVPILESFLGQPTEALWVLPAAKNCGWVNDEEEFMGISDGLELIAVHPTGLSTLRATGE